MGSKEEEKRKEISIIRFAMPHLAILTLSVWNVTHVESYSKKQMNKINWFVVGVVSINWKHCHNSCMILKWKGPYISMYRYHTLMTVFDHVFFVSNSILWINRKKCETFVGVSFCVSAVAGERDKKKLCRFKIVSHSAYLNGGEKMWNRRNGKTCNFNPEMCIPRCTYIHIFACQYFNDLA